MTKRLLPILAILLVGVGTLALPRPSHAQLFGESDEEKAARQKHEDDQDAQISALSQRVNALEDRVHNLVDSLSRATGDAENLSHRVDELSQRLDELSQRLDSERKEFSYRLCVLSARQLGADASNNGLNCAANATPASPGALPPLQPGQPDNGLALPPGILGSLPAGPPNAPSHPQLSSSGGNHAKFDAAMNLLAKAQYDEARVAFRNYADDNPDEDLSSQAIYWIGDIDYVQGNYPNAARSFAEDIKKYPDSTRAPESMLKLGQSLLEMGQKSEGCTALGALQKKYPKAASTILATAANALKAADCSHH